MNQHRVGLGAQTPGFLTGTEDSWVCRPRPQCRRRAYLSDRACHEKGSDCVRLVQRGVAPRRDAQAGRQRPAIKDLTARVKGLEPFRLKECRLPWGHASTIERCTKRHDEVLRGQRVMVLLKKIGLRGGCVCHVSSM